MFPLRDPSAFRPAPWRHSLIDLFSVLIGISVSQAAMAQATPGGGDPLPTPAAVASSPTDRPPVLASVVPPALAKPGSPPFALTVKAGAAYDSDVTVSQINTSTGQSDPLATMALSTSYKIPTSSASSITLGYDFSQSLHQTLSSFDIQLHTASISGALKVRGSSLGLSYSFSHVLLGGHPFLDMHFISPSVLVPVNSQIFVRPSFIYLDERFPTYSTHDAKHSQPGLQAFYFFDQAHAFVLVGANYQRETTAGPEFTYRGYALDASLTLPVRVLRQESKLKASYEWLSYNYDYITPTIGVNRFDRAATFKLAAEMPILKKLSLNIEAKHIVRRSNVYFANLGENVGSAQLVYKFR